MVIKTCKYHGKTEYANNGNHPRCKKCLSEAVMRRRRLIKLKAVEYKGGKCIKCGYNRCINALAFHHRNPSEKKFNLSKKGYCYSWEKVKAEVDKCDLLCNNCHSEIHAEEYEKQNPELIARLNNYNELIPKTKDTTLKTKRKPHQCKSCGIKIKSGQIRCLACHKKNCVKILWPSTQNLIQMITQTSYSAVGRKLGVSDTAIRKRIKNHPND